MIDPLYDFINKKILNKENKEIKKVDIKKTDSKKGTIEDKIIESFNKEIDELVEEINILEKELLNKPNEEVIKRYKGRIKAFLEKVNNNYKSFIYKRWRGGQVKIWQALDKKVEALYKELITSQVKAFDILEKLKDLKGLIIDLKIDGV
ncbi:MAG TPA: DUF327 family protein [Spirochaetota bacterium]|nr:DUF327 family protein [Spirochaetota bacterium]HOM38141.1 DUF327 family protein [Spirochaetota bacterium]HPQ48641.1 DUF327 family protein [Spirochaetota bacterium]